jgi:hypothetical protein
MEMWAKRLHDAAWRSGKYKRYMEKAGFVDVKEVHHHWPINTWPAV